MGEDQKAPKQYQQEQQEGGEEEKGKKESKFFRLSSYFLPRRYDLFFAPKPVGGVFIGSSVVIIEVASQLPQPTRCITLHALDLSIESRHVKIKTGIQHSNATSGSDFGNNATSTVQEEKEKEEDEEEGVLRCVGIHSSVEDETITLEFSSELPNVRGTTFALYFIRFIGAIQGSSNATGIFYSYVRDNNFLSTHLEPTDARRLYPCFDEPSFRAVFQLTVEFDSQYTIIAGTLPVQEELIALDESIYEATFFHYSSEPTTPDRFGAFSNSNSLGSSTPGPSMNSRMLKSEGTTVSTRMGSDMNGMIFPSISHSSFQFPRSQGYEPPSAGSFGIEPHTCSVRRVTFDVTPCLGTYQIGFHTGKFHIIEKCASRWELLCRVIFPDDVHVSQGWYALDLLTKAVDFFDDYYECPLPLAKLDLLAVPAAGTVGASLWGLVPLHQSFLLVGEATPVERRQRIARAVGHGVSLQWLGGWAAVGRWGAAWLAEGVARHLEFAFVNTLFPGWMVWDEFLAQLLDDALTLDAQAEKTHPVNYCSQNPRRIKDTFDSISCGKGAGIIRMLEALLGRGQMQKATQLLLQRCGGSVFDEKIFLSCLHSAQHGAGHFTDEVTAAVLQYAERSGHPLLYIEQRDGICRVTQYETPDLREGILHTYARLQPQLTEKINVIDLMAPRKLRFFKWNIDNFLKRSNYIIPVSIMEVQHGSTSFARTYIIRESQESITCTPNQLIFFNYRGTGVLRCDYDTATWRRIFEISPFLSSEDRMIITITLFRFRNIHIGQDKNSSTNYSNNDDNNNGSSNKINNNSGNGNSGEKTGDIDRCILLLEWLLFISQTTLMNSSQWKYITHNLEQISYMVRDYHCWSVFSHFVCALYAPLLHRGAVSFAAIEKAVSFESQTNLSRETVLHILQLLAICRSPLIHDEAQELLAWALASLSVDTTTTVLITSSRAGGFNVDNDTDAAGVSIAMQSLTERGDSNTWSTLASLLLTLLRHPSQTVSWPGRERRNNSFSVDMEMDSEVLLRISQLDKTQETRWINMIAPAVFALDSSNTLSLQLTVLQYFTTLNAPIAKAMLRNKRLMTCLFEPMGLNGWGKQLSNIRSLLIVYGATFCSDVVLLSLMKACVVGDVPVEGINSPTGVFMNTTSNTTTVTATSNNRNQINGDNIESVVACSRSVVNAIATMEVNCLWMEYCSDHYYNFLSLKFSSNPLTSPGLFPYSTTSETDMDESVGVSI
ncbi:Peptidase M1 [Trypanosoma melophagium]|uniref:Peptidase M1 n=1 Tax=Trypanosoma melophagium TaxID=715481 RepID=UPI003519DE31|nr:Peptidase M1 [Trypanosoma melophagium]